jgi:hypothetical protein
MLTDPENLGEAWEVDVWAPNLNTAHSICEQIASRYLLTEVVNVTQAMKNPSQSGDYKFICWFKSEVKDDGNHNN